METALLTQDNGIMLAYRDRTGASDEYRFAHLNHEDPSVVLEWVNTLLYMKYCILRQDNPQSQDKVSFSQYWELPPRGLSEVIRLNIICTVYSLNTFNFLLWSWIMIHDDLGHRKTTEPIRNPTELCNRWYTRPSTASIFCAFRIATCRFWAPLRRKGKCELRQKRC